MSFYASSGSCNNHQVFMKEEESAPQQEQPLLLNKSKASASFGIDDLVRDMLKKHKTPFMLIRRSVLRKQYERFRKCLPEVTPYYAIKANPYPKKQVVTQAHD